MADYCAQCTVKHLGLPAIANDFRAFGHRMSNHTTYRLVLCEGCGPAVVDNYGTCSSAECSEQHGTHVIPTEEFIRP